MIAAPGLSRRPRFSMLDHRASLDYLAMGQGFTHQGWRMVQTVAHFAGMPDPVHKPRGRAPRFIR
jgi:hypothetical protein